MPIAYYDISAGRIGDTMKIRVMGECDSMECERCELERTDGGYSLKLNHFGLHTVIPYKNGQRGLDCTLFALDDWRSYYQRITESVPQSYENILAYTDDSTPCWMPPGVHYDRESAMPDLNLCESQIWAQSALRYMQLYGYDEAIARDVKNLLFFITTENPGLYLERLTIVRHSQPGTEAYHTYLSTRIQEVFSGVQILLDAYRVFNNRGYLEFAVSTLTALINIHVMDYGEIGRYSYGVR